MKDALSSIVGKRIKGLRKMKGRNQRWLADVLDLSRASISNFERGAHIPQVGHVYTIAEALGVNVGDILPEYEKKGEEEVHQVDVYSSINSDNRLTVGQRHILTDLVTEFLVSNSQHDE